MLKKFGQKNKISQALLSVATSIAILCAVFIGAIDYSIPQEKSVVGSMEVSQAGIDGIGAETIENSATAKLMGVPLADIPVNVIPKMRLIPCGSVFGVKFFTNGVLVVGISDVESTDGILNPAKSAGLQVGDVIFEIDGAEVNTVEEVSQKVEKCDGGKLGVRYIRDGKKFETSLEPLLSLSENKYKTGLWIRDSTAGIGTITYYNPDNHDFAGLGHGICDVDTGLLMPMQRANVVGISVTDIIPGRNGIPGEIKGTFGIIKNGILYKNTEVGVFGNLSEKPLCAFNEPIEVADSNQVHEGKAYIYSSLGDNNVGEYEIELTKIYRNNSKTKNFIFTVSDKNLLSRTGGIVQGMSGSPIVQDGKLIGAVTHVLVNSPEKGYGIFIENMLGEAIN